MRELVVISGKGGTGKTSVVASFAALAESKVLADCDVDAADLHLILDPQIVRREDFVGGKSAKIAAERCVGCGKCAEVCRFEAVSFDGPANDVVEKTYRIDEISCEGCGLCAHFCPADAVEFSPSVNGEWYISETRHGPMVHAKLGIAQENSGKLVTTVRKAARELAKDRGLDLVIIDGSPGIGCPVMASVTGTSMALIVTEPTLSGLHDLDRIAALTRHFNVPTVVCINKTDINPEMSCGIRRHCSILGIDVAGEIRYDPDFTRAQIAGKSVVEFSQGDASREIAGLWRTVAARLESLGQTPER